MKSRMIPGVIAMMVPVAAQAEEPSLSFGVIVASEYVSSGVRFSDGIVVQPYVELGYRGFYAGAYASNVDPDLTLANVEYGLSLGYRGEVGKFSYDAAINYYLYDEAFSGVPVTDYAELFLEGTFTATESLYLTASVSIASEFDQKIVELGVNYYTLIEGLSVGGIVGRIESDFGDWNYWSVGTTYQFSEKVGVGLVYYDSTVDPDLGFLNTDGLFVASMSIAF